MFRFSPGFLTSAGADALSAAVVQAQVTAREIDRLENEYRDELPARLTAWDSATQSASWTEEAYDATGARYVWSPVTFAPPVVTSWPIVTD